MLFTPQLPARAGYVEVIDEYGNHVYKPTPETLEKQKQQALMDELQSKLTEANSVIDALLGTASQEGEVAV